jgi:pyruvate formate lyase activating enzyme
VKIYIAGWKSVSLVDVVGHVTFTLWTCGCNLMCPFCHNWRLAERDSKLCKWVEVDEVVDVASNSKFLVDYFHVTGGEPLIQFKALMELLEKTHKLGLLNSVNSNLTAPIHYLKQLVDSNLVDHVATDLKIPPDELFGLPPRSIGVLWRNYVESLKLVGRRGIPIELRIPLHKGLTFDVFKRYFSEISSHLVTENVTVVLNQLVGEPFTHPRNPSWCRERCGVGEEVIKELVEFLSHMGFNRIVVKSVPGFGQ